MSDVTIVEIEKEQTARRLIYRSLGTDIADTWPVEDVFEYLEADGFEWIDGQWEVVGRSAWTGFDDIGLVPALT